MATTPPIIPGVSSIATGPSGIGAQQNPPQQPQLPPGTIVQGTVAGQDAKGNTIIQNDTLRLVVSTQYQMGKGAQVSVRIDAPVTKDALPPVRIIAVDGKSPPTLQLPASPEAPPAAASPDVAQRGNLQAEQAKPVGILLDMVQRSGGGAKQPAVPAQAESPAAHTAARGVAAEVLLSEGQKAAAVLLRPTVNNKALALLSQLVSHTGAAFSASTGALRPGLQLQVQMAPMPAAQGQTATPSGAPQQPPAPDMGATPTPAAPQATPQAAPSAQFRAGYAQYAKQAPAMMPGAPPASPGGTTPPPAAGAGMAAPPPAAAAPVNISFGLTLQAVEQLLARAEAQPMLPGQLAGVVMGKEPGGAVIVQTRLGMFTLPQAQVGSAQPGTVQTWQVNTMTLPLPGEGLPPIGGSGGVLAAASQFTAEWSALDELSSLLHGMHSSMAAQALQRIVPHVGTQFSAGMLFFMNILRRGDVSEWLGKDLIEHLERMGKGDLVQRLGADLGAVRTLFTDQPQGNWQALFFPVMVEKELHHAQMFIKPEEQERKEGGGGTRFIVELELSHLGPMQMDGLVKKRAEHTQFDLVIRSIHELPEEMKTDIYGIFENAQQVTGLQGSLNFRLVQEFPVHPLQEIQKQAGEGGGIMA